MKSIIGPYTKIKHIEKGNGTDLYRICKQQQMIPMATWKKPRIHKQDRWKQKAGNLTKEAWGEENKEKIPNNMDKPEWKHQQTN